MVDALMQPKFRSFSGLNTEPANSTGHVVTGSGGIAIRWVFPDAEITQFAATAKVLGREKACDTPLLGLETSRQHAEVWLDGPVPMIRDLGSRNGVFVNGHKVSQAGLNFQDVVRLGDWVGVIVPLDEEVDVTFRSITPGWYGSNKLIQAVDPARRVAKTDLPITIEGETGTGKEGLARAIHTWSERNGSFVGVNCATIQPELAEATLFGHRKGAFTGADRAAIGYFRAANGGTLLLDEIVELPQVVQAKLLRALEEKEVVPVGETDPVSIDVRVLAATQEPLRQAACERRFRADLMARLEGLTVVLPPLRGRREDVAPLLLTFLREMSGGNLPKVDHRLIEQVLLYDWPLNVRELAHLARQLLALHSAEPTLRRSLLPPRIREAGKLPEEPGQTPTRSATQDEEAFEKLVSALRANAGNVARAAAALGISRARAYRLLDARPDFEVASLRVEGDRP
jgi:transcriptional regulator with AAA-type ATPase domain